MTPRDESAPARKPPSDDAYYGAFIIAAVLSIGGTMVLHHWMPGDIILLFGIAILAFVWLSFILCMMLKSERKS